jgi:hypothetical protein
MKELKIGFPHGVICPSSVHLKYLFLHAIMYYALSMEVKPKTISRLKQKTDTMAQPEKKFLQPTRSECKW